jgi:hypothetical protein
VEAFITSVKQEVPNKGFRGGLINNLAIQLIVFSDRNH